MSRTYRRINHHANPRPSNYQKTWIALSLLGVGNYREWCEDRDPRNVYDTQRDRHHWKSPLREGPRGWKDWVDGAGGRRFYKRESVRYFRREGKQQIRDALYEENCSEI